MLYITVALSAEARPLIEHFKLTRTYALPYTMFENEEVKLIVTGVGIENAMMATSAFLGHFPPSSDDVFFNIGICAAPKSFEIGEAVLAHKITSNLEQKHSYFPDILFEHTLSECELLCVSSPQNTPLHVPTDMESYGVYKAVSRFLDTHQILFFKVVSDHFEPENVSKELTIELISKNLKNLDAIIRSAFYVTKKDSLFTQDEKEDIKQISDCLTKAQGDAFYDACCYYKLHHKKALHAEYPLGISPPPQKSSKQERNKYFESLIKTLTL